jgi:hypothetical protein
VEQDPNLQPAVANRGFKTSTHTMVLTLMMSTRPLLSVALYLPATCQLTNTKQLNLHLPFEDPVISKREF